MKEYQQIDFSELELQELLNYVINKHHTYCKQMLPIIHNHLQTLVARAEKNNTDFKSILLQFNEFTAILEQHLRKEEQILFPFVRKILNAEESSQCDTLLQVPLIKNPLIVLQKEHKKLTWLLSMIRKESYNFFIPNDSSTAFKLCYIDLYDFEKEFHKQIYVEERFLFPKILELHKSIKENLKTSNHE